MARLFNTSRNNRFVALLMLVICTATLFLTGCERQESNAIEEKPQPAPVEILEFRNAEMVHGLVYRQGWDTPFTGEVRNIPIKTVFPNGIWRVYSLLKEGFEFDPMADNVATYNNQREVYNAILPIKSALGMTQQGVCNVDVKDGYFHGNVVCIQAWYETRLLTQLNRGRIDSYLQIYASKSAGGNLLVDIGIQNGLVHGPIKMFYPAAIGIPADRITLFEANANQGHFQGEMRRYFPFENISLIRHYNDQGIRIGREESYYRSGTPYQLRNYNEQGQGHGEQVTYHRNGQINKHWYMDNGNIIGEFNTYTSSGELYTSNRYENGRLVEN